MNQPSLHRIANTMGLTLISVVLSLALMDQFYEHDLPCPLCLLQRTCYTGIGLCLYLNLSKGIKTSHYGLMTLNALLGLGLSIRQIYLHSAPTDPGYGNTFLGLKMYAWSAILFPTIIGLIAIGMLFEQAFKKKSFPVGLKLQSLMIFFLILILLNGISTFMECGIWICPDNPIAYYLLNHK